MRRRGYAPAPSLRRCHVPRLTPPRTPPLPAPQHEDRQGQVQPLLAPYASTGCGEQARAWLVAVHDARKHILTGRPPPAMLDAYRHSDDRYWITVQARQELKSRHSQRQSQHSRASHLAHVRRRRSLNKRRQGGPQRTRPATASQV